jgi:hypothetical protein
MSDRTKLQRRQIITALRDMLGVSFEDEVVAAIRDMKPRTKLYEAVKAELKRQRHWKDLPRGPQAIKKPRT